MRQLLSRNVLISLVADLRRSFAVAVGAVLAIYSLSVSTAIADTKLGSSLGVIAAHQHANLSQMNAFERLVAASRGRVTGSASRNLNATARSARALNAYQQMSLVELQQLKPSTPNPYLAFLPQGAQPDYSYWREVMGRQADQSYQRRSGPRSNTPSFNQLVSRSEDEASGTTGENDTTANAEYVDGFGSDAGDDPEAEITGELSAATITPVPGFTFEDDGSITLANDPGLVAETQVFIPGNIGDGPFGATSGDFDYFRLPGLSSGEQIGIEISIPNGDLDSFLIAYDSAGDQVGSFDPGGQGLSGSFLFTAPAAGDFFLAVMSWIPNQADPFDSSSGSGAQTAGNYELVMSRFAAGAPGDVDAYAFDLEAGDVISGVLGGSAQQLSLRDPADRLLIASQQDASFVYPADSPLPGGGNAVVGYVVPETGRYVMAVSVGEGTYTLNLDVFRPGLETSPNIAETQILFLDFDGATADPAKWGGPAGDATFSPLSAFLTDWELAPEDENELIDAIIAVVAENLSIDMRTQGTNGDRDTSNIGGDFDIELRNSRDDGELFGQPNVSRVIVGGTVDELGFVTIGIAESLDVGNFDSTEDAIVLLDLLSEPGGFDSLNQFSVAPGSSKLELVATGVGNIVSHEAGHFFANFHTDQDNGQLNIMDQGGDLAGTVGLGPDGVFGTLDDVDVDFGEDHYVPNEGFAGLEDTLNSVAHGLSTPFGSGEPGYFVTPNPVAATEGGGSETVTIGTSTPPGEDIIVFLNPTSANCSTNPTSVTLNDATFPQGVTVEVTATDDADNEGDHDCLILTDVPFPPFNPDYLGLNPDDITVNITDNDAVGQILVDPTEVNVSEVGDTADVVIRLGSQPASDVTVSFTASPGGNFGCLVMPQSVTLTSANWSDGQTITIAAIDDQVAEGEHSCTVLSNAASSDDPSYDGIDADDVAVTIADNDSAGLTIAPTSLTLSENDPAGETFRVSTTSEPEAPITIDLTLSSAECSLSSNQVYLDFEIQFADITVTPVDDTAEDGTQSCDVTTQPSASADPNYNNIDIDDVTVQVLDDDTVSRLSVNDVTQVEGNNGTSDFAFTVSLSPASTETVTVFAATVAGTATDGEDYQGFAANDGEQPLYGLNSQNDQIVQYDPATGAETFIANAPQTGNGEEGLAYDGELIWYTQGGTEFSAGLGLLISIDPATGEIQSGHPYNYRGITGALAYLNGKLYIPDTNPDDLATELLVFDIATATFERQPFLASPFVGGSGPVSGALTGAANPDALLGAQLDLFENQIYLVEIDVATNTITNRLPTGFTSESQPIGMAAADGLVYTNFQNFPNVFVGNRDGSGSGLSPIQGGFSVSALGGDEVQSPGGQQVVFAAGETTQIVNVPVNGDFTLEADETFALQLGSPENAEIDDGEGLGTIVNDESTRTVTIDDPVMAEGDDGQTVMRFTLTLSEAPGLDTVSVDFATRDGTASSTVGGANPPGDGGGDGDGGDPGDPGDPGIPPFPGGPPLPPFPGGPPLPFFNAFEGEPADYEATSGTVNFPPGPLTTATIDVPVNGDLFFEPDETFFVDMNNPVNASFGDPEGQATIANDDERPVITIADAAGPEVTTIFLTASLSAASSETISFDYSTADGTATLADNDYLQVINSTVTFQPGQTTAQVGVGTTSDEKFELDETVFVNLDNAVNATIADPQGIATIENNDTQPSIRIDDPEVAEGTGGVRNLVFTVSLSNRSYQEITVNFATADGTALAGEDYGAITGTLTFAENELTKTIAVPLVTDNIQELDETLFMDLSEPVNATLEETRGNGVILDDDGQPLFSIDDASVLEGDDGQSEMIFTVRLSHPSSINTVSADYQSLDAAPFGAPLATAGSDYQAVSGTLTYPPNTTEQTITVPVNGDVDVEDDEQFRIELSNFQNASFSDRIAHGTIENDDDPARVTIDDVSLEEGDSGTTAFQFTVSLESAVAFPVTIDYTTADLTAEAPEDYVSDAGTVTFAAGETSKTITVLVNGDETWEPGAGECEPDGMAPCDPDAEVVHEQFLVQLSADSGNVAFDKDEGVGEIINDDDRPVLSIEDASAEEGDAGDTTDLTFTAQLSNPSDTDTRIYFDTQDQTAEFGLDYQSGGQGRLFVVDNDNTIYNIVEINPENGETLNQFSAPFNAPGPIPGNLVANGLAYDGEFLWYTITHNFGSSSENVRELYKLNPDTGEEIDSIFDGFDDGAWRGLAVVGDGVFVYDTNAGAIKRFFRSSLGFVRDIPLDRHFTGGLTGYGPFHLLFGSNGNSLYSINPNQVTPTSTLEFSIPSMELIDGAGANADEVFLEVRSFSEPHELRVYSRSGEFLRTLATDFLPTAVAGDVTGSSSGTDSIVIPAGETSAEIKFDVIGDDLPEDNETFQLRASSNQAAGFPDGLDFVPDVVTATGTIIDNEPGLTIGDVSLAEGNSGSTAFDFEVVLSRAVDSPVTVDFATSDGTATVADNDYGAISGTLTFQPGESLTQLLSVSVTADQFAEPDEQFTITLGNASGALLRDAEGLGSIVNDDSAGITVDPLEVVLVEGGDNASVTFTLDSAPTADVTIPLTLSSAQCTVSSNLVTLTADNFAAGVAVILSAVDDLNADGNQPCNLTTGQANSSDTDYAGLDPDDVAVTVNDNDSAGINVAPTELTIAEGESDSFVISLQSQPFNPVTIGLSVNDNCSISATSVTLDGSNHADGVSITVTSIEDEIDDDATACLVSTAAATSDDPGYDGIDPADVTVSVTDNDQAGITVAPQTLELDEGDAADFSIALGSQPTDVVTIGLSVNDRCSLSAESVTLDASNYVDGVSVAVTAVDNNIADGGENCEVVTAPASSADDNYSGLDPANVIVTVEDDEQAGITVTPLSLTIAEGDTASFTITLDTQPVSPVQIDLPVDPTGQCGLSSTRVILTADNFEAGVPVQVTAADDAVIEGEHGCEIGTSPAVSDDPAYAGRDAENVVVTIVDNDSASVTVSPLSLTVTEGGAAESFVVSLGSEPQSPVTIALQTSNEQCAVSTDAVVLDADNFTGVTVSVTAIDDAVAEGAAVDCVVETSTASSSDTAYDGLEVDDVTVTVNDNDMAAINVSPVALTITEGETGSFSIALATLPGADVVIGLAIDGDACSIDIEEAVLNSNNWQSGVTVTVTTNADGRFTAEDRSCTVVTAAAVSEDANYDGVDAEDVSVTLQNVDAEPADLALTLSASDRVVFVDETVTVTFRATNNSDLAAESVTLDVALTGSNVSLGTLPADCVSGGTEPQTLQCTLGSLPAGQQVELGLSFSSAERGDIFVAGLLRQAEEEQNQANNADYIDINVTDTTDNGPSQSFSGARVSSTATGDIDGDGDIDAVLATSAGEASEVWRNNGEATFSFDRTLGDTADSRDALLVDLDNDGDLDLVLANGSGQGNSLWRNDGSGVFTQYGSLGSSSSLAVATADVNGDRFADLVFANGEQPNSLWLNDTTGNFPTQIDLPSGATAGAFARAASADGNAISLALGDLNGDGLDDIVIGNADGPNEVLLNLNGSFGNATLLGDGNTRSVTLLDIDNDGDLDIVFGQAVSDPADPQTPPDQIYLNTGLHSANFSLASEFGSSETVDVKAGDLNGDGNLDLIVVNGTGAQQIYLGDGAGSFTLDPLLATSGNGVKASLNDLDGDGDLDLLVSNGNNGGVVIYINPGNAKFGNGEVSIEVAGGSGGGGALRAIDWLLLVITLMMTLGLGHHLERWRRRRKSFGQAI